MEPANKSRILFSSGGSTGSPKYTELTISEVMTNSAVHGKGYAACGIGWKDVVATWGLPGVMNSEFTVYLALSMTGCMILPIGEVGGPAGILKLLKDFKPNVLLVMPSDLAVLTRYMEECGEKLPGVRLIVTGGEPLYPVDQERFRLFFGEGVKFKSVFQTSDTGTIGYQCDHLSGQQFHVHDDLQIVTIADPDENGVGELLTTNLMRQHTLVIRTPTGDRARKLEGTCPCGRKSTRIELMGRSGQFVKLGGEKFDLNWLSQMRDQLGVALDDFQVHAIRSSAGLDGMKMLSNHVAGNDLLKAKAQRIFGELSVKVTQQLREDVIAPLQFAELSAEKHLTGASGKFKFFVDCRQA